MKYSDLANKVLDPEEMLTTLIEDLAQLLKASTRMLELEMGIRSPADPDTHEQSIYNAKRNIVKKTTVVVEDLRALGYLPDQQTDNRFYLASKYQEAKMGERLLHYHPELKDIIAGKKDDPNPYHDAVKEDLEE